MIFFLVQFVSLLQDNHSNWMLIGAQTWWQAGTDGCKIHHRHHCLGNDLSARKEESACLASSGKRKFEQFRVRLTRAAKSWQCEPSAQKCFHISHITKFTKSIRVDGDRWRARQLYSSRTLCTLCTLRPVLGVDGLMLPTRSYKILLRAFSSRSS